MQYVIIGAVAAAVSYGMSYAMAQEQNITSEGSRVDDLRAIGSKYNEGLPRAFGLNRLPMNVVWARPLREERVTSTQQTGGGGKGGGGAKVTSTNYYYYATFGGLLARGEQNRPLRMWFDKRLVWEAPGGQRVLSGTLSGGGDFEFLTGAADQNPPNIAEGYLGLGNTPGYRGSCGVFFHNVPVEQYGNRIPSVEVEVAQAAPGQGVTAGDVIQAVAREVGLEPQFIDTAEVDRDVTGLKVEPGPAAAVLEELMTVLHLQAVFSEGRLKFRPLEQPVALEIPEGDLIVKSGSLFPVSRVREDDLPRSVSVEYIDPARDYQPNSQRVIRHSTASRQEIVVSANMGMSAQAAAACADVLLYRAWAARNRFGPFHLPRKYLSLEPGDVVGVTAEGERHLVRITALDLGADLSMKVEGESYDPVVMTGLAVGDSGEGFPGQGLPYFGDTRFFFLDLPALSAAEADQSGIYVAASGTGEAWRGAALERSADRGANWEAAGLLPVYSIMGECEDILPPPPPEVSQYQWDYDSTVTVSLVKGELSSTTLEQVYAGRNSFIVGREVIQALTVTSLGGGRYRLSTLLRGRRGTEEAMRDHGPAEAFALTEGLLFVPMEPGTRGADRRYRLTPFGSTETVEQDFASQGLTAIPRRPVGLIGWRDELGNLWLQWFATSRKSTELPNSGEEPAEYEPLRFRVRILNDGGAEVRSLTVEGSPAAVYSAEQQVADFGGLRPRVSVAVAQWSPVAGWGHAAETVL